MRHDDIPSVEEAESLLRRAKSKRRADRRARRAEEVRRIQERRDIEKAGAHRAAEVRERVRPFLGPLVQVEFDPNQEGTLTLRHPNYPDLVISATGDEMTCLTID